MQSHPIITSVIALVARVSSTEQALAAGAPGGATRPFKTSGISFRDPAAWRESPRAWLDRGGKREARARDARDPAHHLTLRQSQRLRRRNSSCPIVITMITPHDQA